MKQTSIILGLFLLLFTAACKKKEPEVIDLKYDYFQLVEGAYVTYDVTYIFHDEALLKHDTVVYQIKTVVGDSVIDNAGRVARKFNRYIREASTDPWATKDVWTGIITDGRAELVEENQRKVKLVFAPTEDKTWDINYFNSDGKVTASYDSIDVSRSIQGLDFYNTLIVRQKNYITLIDEINNFEIYARNVGMIFKQEKSLKYNFGETIPNYGTEYYYRINA